MRGGVGEFAVGVGIVAAERVEDLCGAGAAARADADGFGDAVHGLVPEMRAGSSSLASDFRLHAQLPPQPEGAPMPARLKAEKNQPMSTVTVVAPMMLLAMGWSWSKASRKRLASAVLPALAASQNEWRESCMRGARMKSS